MPTEGNYEISNLPLESSAAVLSWILYIDLLSISSLVLVMRDAVWLMPSMGDIEGLCIVCILVRQLYGIYM